MTPGAAFPTMASMQTSLLIVLLFAFGSLCGSQAAQRYLYMSTPDGAQSEGHSGNGILVFDIDHGHRFVRRIEIPSFREGLRGFTGNAKTHRLFYSTSNRRLGCFDLETDRVIWERVDEAGCDRSSVTPDGGRQSARRVSASRATNAGSDTGLMPSKRARRHQHGEAQSRHNRCVRSFRGSCDNRALRPNKA